MRTIDELVDVADPGWPVVTDALAAGSADAVVLPPDSAACRATLRQLQVTARSLLGAVVLNSGGILLHHGLIRVYGGSGGRLPSLAEVNRFPDPVDPEWSCNELILAHDVLGGVFALKGRGVAYFGPDSLEWLDLEAGHSQWTMWLAQGGAMSFYQDLLWPSWESEVTGLGLRQGIGVFPPLWSKEAREDMAATSRRPVPLAEILRLHSDTCAQFGIADPGDLGAVT
jgi:hypothetical protein